MNRQEFQETWQKLDSALNIHDYSTAKAYANLLYEHFFAQRKKIIPGTLVLEVLPSLNLRDELTAAGRAIVQRKTPELIQDNQVLARLEIILDKIELESRETS